MSYRGGDLVQNGSGYDNDESGSRKRARPDEQLGALPANGLAFQQEAGNGEDDGEELDADGRDLKTGRRKIKIEFIQDKSRRHITFSKRKAGIMKKAYELSTLTGTQVLLLVVSETGLVYTFTTAKLQPLVTQPEGKNLIQACLNAPTGQPPNVLQAPLPPQQQVSIPQPGANRGGMRRNGSYKDDEGTDDATSPRDSNASSAGGPFAVPPGQQPYGGPQDMYHQGPSMMPQYALAQDAGQAGWQPNFQRR